MTDEHLHRAIALHREAVVIDTHCDTTQRLADPAWSIIRRDRYGHVDLPRLREGGVDALFLAAYAPELEQPGDGISAAIAQIARIHDAAARHADQITLARSAFDVRAAKEAGKVALLVAVEGGHLIENSIDVLRDYHDRGAMYLTLTHSFHTNWADSSGVRDDLAPRHGGLTDFGKEVVRELNRLGMMVDVSHASDATFWDVLETSSAPVIASHSSCRAVAPHRRNLSDEMIRAIAEKDGIVQINFALHFVDRAAPPLSEDAIKRWLGAGGVLREPVTDHVTPLSVLVDHFDHAMQLVGPKHVGIGSDFDGVPALPTGMEHCGKLPHITAALFARGYTETQVRPMLGENVLRVLDACAAAAAHR